jgi:hypothetical protein
VRDSGPNAGPDVLDGLAAAVYDRGPRGS